MILFTAKNFTIGDVRASGLMVELVAGEAITALDACYIKASDGLAYKLGTGVAEANTAIAIMAIETVAISIVGRFMLKGTLEYASWTLTPGNKIDITATPGTISEASE
jgi:hypothetical protein